MTIHGFGFGYNSLLCLLLLQSFQIGVNACAFKCGDGSCIEASEICNGQRDCRDGSDETREVCAVLPCRNALGLGELLGEQSFGLGDEDISFASSFRCEYGGCISTNFKCNGISNCADDSDETAEVCKDTNCNANSFRCDYGACISRQDVCDGVKNCRDGSDERPENCKFRGTMRRVVCPKRSKKFCDNRRECYDRREECDGKFDCADKSDEKPELCQLPNVVAPSPTTAPATSPPVVFPPAGPSVSEVGCPPPNCHCPLPGLEHFCLPCGEIADLNATCLSLDKKGVCSVNRDSNSGVSVDVLSCGTEALLTTASFSRNAQSCGDKLGMVPTMTLVFVDCWGVASQIMRCHSDGYWRVDGAQMSGSNDFDSINSLKEKQPMKQLCQPNFMNSQVCGRRSRYMSTGKPIFQTHNFHLENRYPMVMGLLESKRYICSATLISPQFLLTAGHCVIVSQDSKNQTIDVRDLKVQLDARNTVWVSQVILHRDYTPGTIPLNDLAFLRLERPLLFSSKLYPACVDLTGQAILLSYSAVTFSRRHGKNEFSYDEIQHQIDRGCYDRTNRCDRLQVTENQFCGVGVDPENKRILEGGSSGGPFLQNYGSDDSEEWTVSGVLSFRHSQHTCEQQYTVFTAVNDYEKWITDVVHNEI